MKLIHERISDTAAAFPAKAVAADPFGEMSYGELEARSASLASVLASLGFEKGDATAVYVPFVKEIVLGAVSAIRAGGVFVPFDDAYPAERLEYMLEDSEAKAVLTLRAFWERKKLKFPEERVVFMDEVQAGRGKPVPVRGLLEDSPAMLLYTSGTTGKPKGVMHSHRMLLHIADFMNAQEGAEMNADSRSGIMTGFTFMGSQIFVWAPLAKGGTVCICPEAARKDLGYLHQFLRESRITHTFLSSSLAAILAEDYDISGIYVFAGGEKMRNFKACSPGNYLYNLYGSTEISGILSKKIHGDEERILVGRPYTNSKAMIVDDAMKPVKPGEAGELLLSNDYMSLQYFKLPELGAEKWVELDGRLWFRMGDRAVLTPGGDYDILGRIDNMVKLRGFRIETGEVEAQVSNAVSKLGRTDVRQIVVVVKTVSGTEHLTCYYEAQRELDKQAITGEISKYLTEYMVPDIWVRMDSFPRNANGKVLRKELPQPKRERKAVGVLDSEVIARVLFTAEDLLEPEGYISPDDRFTDLGGTSLTAMKLAAMLREQGIKITGAQVLKYNVLRRIAEAADVAYEQLWTQEEYEAVRKDFAARGEHIRKVLPISSEQDEMLFMQLLHPDRSHIRDMWFLQLDSLVSEEHLREALDIVARENEALRSSIVFRNVSVVQQVITDRRIPLEMIEADGFGSREMAELRKDLLYTPIDLQQDSMMKAIGIHDDGRSFLCILSYTSVLGAEEARRCLLRLMEILEEKYPDDVSIRDWRELLEMGLSLEDGEEKKPVRKPGPVGIRKDAPPEICVYSENNGPKLVFVHTGNTGSEAYYQLADRIGDVVSFAVIEPFNLYHPEEAVYGIKGIASNYIRILKRYQPEGPYLIGGWCYGGVVAQEMACQLEQAGEEVRHLFMLDSHALGSENLRAMSRGMFSGVNREYFETCPLFAELRENGMLEAMVTNAAHVAEDMANHMPSFFHGDVTYFKPEQVPAGVTGDNLRYWEKMMEFEAGNYENYCSKEKLRIIRTPHEHDLMMDDPSLDIIAPVILETVRNAV